MKEDLSENPNRAKGYFKKGFGEAVERFALSPSLLSAKEARDSVQVNRAFTTIK